MRIITVYFIISFFFSSQSNAQDSIAFRTGYSSYSGLKFDEAVYWFSISIDKDHYRISDSYRYRGMARALMNDFTSAKDDLFNSYSLDSLNQRIDYFIGKFYYLQDMFDSSIVWYNKAIRKNNRDADFYDSRSLAYAGIDQLTNALADANIALKFNPISDIYLNNHGLIQQKQAKYNEALLDYNKALKIDTSLANNLSTYINIAFCHFKLGAYEKSLQECNDVLKRFPNTPYALLVRGQVFTALGKKEESCNDFRLLFSLSQKMGKEYVEKYCN